MDSFREVQNIAKYIFQCKNTPYGKRRYIRSVLYHCCWNDFLLYIVKGLSGIQKYFLVVVVRDTESGWKENSKTDVVFALDHLSDVSEDRSRFGFIAIG